MLKGQVLVQTLLALHPNLVFDTNQLLDRAGNHLYGGRLLPSDSLIKCVCMQF